jgi:hypothetical protein
MSKIELHLSDDERQELTRLVSSGRHPARMVRRAQILLRSAEGWTDPAIGAAIGVSRQTVYEVRTQAVRQGVDACLQRTSGRRPASRPRRWTGRPKRI